MDRLEELKSKYQQALETVKQQGVRLTHLHVQDNKLFMQGMAPSEQAKNAVWNAIKAADPHFGDLTCDLTVDASLAQAAAAGQPSSGSMSTATSGRTYTVQPGDSLSKIAQRFYNNGNEYMKIFEANRDQLSDPNRIDVGQELVIP